MKKCTIQLKRIYDSAEATDGFRILVDRLWSRGLTKKEARIDLWLKELAPSDLLRKSFGHDPSKWKEFKKRYFQELKDKSEIVKIIIDKGKERTVTLVYGAKDTEHNNAVAFKEYLEQYKF